MVSCNLKHLSRSLESIPNTSCLNLINCVAGKANLYKSLFDKRFLRVVGIQQFYHLQLALCLRNILRASLETSPSLSFLNWVIRDVSREYMETL